MAKTFICANCEGEFERDPKSDKRAHEEAQARFGRDGTADDMEIVCGDCYREIMEFAKETGLLQSK